MSIQQMGDSQKMYLSIIKGTLVQKVDETTPGAKKRTYEIGSGSDKTMGTKWEISYRNLSGRITGLEFKDGKFGEQFILSMADEDNNYQIAMPTRTNKYFTDFAKKLPNIDTGKEIEFNPYDFEAEGKKRQGVSIVQGGEKVMSHYWDGKKSINGMIKKDEGDDWEDYFKKEYKFLKKEVETVKIAEPIKTEDATAVFDADKADLPF